MDNGIDVLMKISLDTGSGGVGAGQGGGGDSGLRSSG